MAELKCSGRIDVGGFKLDVPPVCIPGEGVTVLFGPSGSGKSTLLKALGGVVKAPQFLVRHGQETWQAPGRVCPPQARGIGMVQQGGVLFPHMNVGELLRFPLKYARRQIFTFETVVAWLALEPLLQQKPAQLSGGQRQRVALGQALLRQPAWLFLDEPLTGLDRHSREGLLLLLERVVKEAGVPTLMVTHALDEVERLGDWVLFVEQGRLQGIPADTVQTPLSIWQAVAQADSPLFREEDPVSLLQGRAVCSINAQGLGEVQVGEHTLLLTHPLSAKAGESVRLRVAAKQLLLAQQRLDGVSALNQLALRVVDIHRRGFQAFIKLAVSEQQVLWAMLTEASVKSLGLEVGRKIWVVIKAVGVL